MNRYDYRSGFEAQIAADLAARGIVYEYEELVLEYVSPVRNGLCTKCACKQVVQRRKYTPDFVIRRGCYRAVLLVEAKGILDSATRSKMRDVKRACPDKDIRFLFTGKATWTRSKAVIKWCEKNGFPYHFGHVVPEAWL